jgi:hypothetical protein
MFARLPLLHFAISLSIVSSSRCYYEIAKPAAQRGSTVLSISHHWDPRPRLAADFATRKLYV